MISINRLIDYIQAPEDTFDQYLQKAKEHDFRCVFANRFEFEQARDYLLDSDVIVAGYCDFPNGEESVEAQLADFEDQYRVGFREIEGILNQHAVEHRLYDYLERQMTEIALFCRDRHIDAKIIIETCKMDEECLTRVCEIALACRPTCLKTSTGESFKGAELDKVKLMKSLLGDEVQIKAAGGIRTYQQAQEFLAAGASVLGASAAIQITQEQQALLGA
ncbi:deoxyribose-phosphate aldolase [Thermophilibacter immobilis]|uniref:deoxyribose-phosphate aldolase n=1 Tax=Thermophilibacter immobilis TaxID=2779519 RepID=UPI001E501FCF|nr:deoxyribose-phosphate aldolase [Thermophilibacter immobilis]